MNMLIARRLFVDKLLPNIGVRIELERQLSPVFIPVKTYGTRSSTIILMRRNGQIQFIEQGYEPNKTRLEKLNAFGVHR